MPVLEMRGIGKAFSGNQVLADVNLTARAGEVLALVGENGAGKSTLMKILAGVHQPDGGEILLDGQAAHFARPADALTAGIAMIYQELSLAPHLTVAENIFLGREPVKLGALGLINQRALNDRARQLLNEYGFKLDPQARVGRLSAASRQLVEITRAIVEAKRVIVMDEPTSSLTNHEVEELFRLIRALKQRGLAVIYISHRLEELDEIADHLTILRDGRAVYKGVWGAITTDEMIRQMAGRELKEIFPPRQATLGEVKLRVRQLSHPPKFENASFEARAGEVVGIAGLAGAGRTEMLEAIFGAHPAISGEVEINGAAFFATHPNAAIKTRDESVDGRPQTHRAMFEFTFGNQHHPRQRARAGQRRAVATQTRKRSRAPIHSKAEHQTAFARQTGGQAERRQSTKVVAGALALRRITGLHAG